MSWHMFLHTRNEITYVVAAVSAAGGLLAICACLLDWAGIIHLNGKRHE